MRTLLVASSDAVATAFALSEARSALAVIASAEV
jgi:hypothetical protein